MEGGDLLALSQTLAVDDPARLSEVIPALASWRRRERDDSVLAGWRYRISWVPVPDSAPVLFDGTWLVVVPSGDHTRLAADCTQLLAARGAQVVLLELAVGEPGRTALTARITRLAAEYPAGFGGVLSLLALDEEALPPFGSLSGDWPGPWV